jgi:hypothetical protein
MRSPSSSSQSDPTWFVKIRETQEFDNRILIVSCQRLGGSAPGESLAGMSQNRVPDRGELAVMHERVLVGDPPQLASEKSPVAREERWPPGWLIFDLI